MELLVVCILIGASLGLVAPSLKNNLIDEPLNLAARKLIGYVDGARERAVRRRTPHILFFDKGLSKLAVREDLAGKEDEEEDDSEDLIRQLTLPSTVRIAEIWSEQKEGDEEQRARVWINPRGLLQRTVIVLEDQEGERLAVDFKTFFPAAELHSDFSPPEGLYR